MNIDYLNSIVERIKSTDEPIAITPRELFSAFGFVRRSKNNCRAVDDYLKTNDLIVEPHYNSVWVDATINLVPKEKAKRRSSVDPIKKLQLLPAANKVPCYVDNSDTLDKAITLLMLHHYSHLPVTKNKLRGVIGYVSWKTIGEAHTRGIYSNMVKDYVNTNFSILPQDAPLLESIQHVYDNGFILVKNEKDELTGIVTTKDISTQFLMWTKPFLLLEEIENQLRSLLDGKFLLEELQEYCVEEKKTVSSLDDLTFGEYLFILQNPKNWKKIGITTVDHKTFTGELDAIREIRNDVMHFDPDGLSEEQIIQLRNMCGFLSTIVEQPELNDKK